MTDSLDRIVNPGVILTMILAGIAYGRLLWSVNLRPNASLWVMAVGPGAIYLLMIWATRAAQGTVSLVYVALLIDWLIFANSGFLAVLGARRWRRR